MQYFSTTAYLRRVDMIGSQTNFQCYYIFLICGAAGALRMNKEREEMKMFNEMIGKKVIIRGDRSGVFFGTLEEVKKNKAKLTNCRRLWYWDGANSISQLALDGTAKPYNCRFTVSVESIVIMDCIEIIPCTDKSIESIEGVSVWKQ